MATLQDINQFTEEQFVEVFGGIFEDSPWIAEKAAQLRPFPSMESAFEAMRNIVEKASEEEKEKLILKHPELASRISMSNYSQKEQASAGLHSLTSEEFETMTKLNKQYKEKFQFPFIIFVAGLDKPSIMKAMESRLQNNKTVEFHTALNEIYKIARNRFNQIAASD